MDALARKTYGVHDINPPSDLRWDLSNIKKQDDAREFIRKFENKLCVFSPSVRQIYSSYSIYIPENESRSVVILPDPYAFHNTFNRIDDSAIRPTGIYIVPGEQLDREGLHLVVKVKHKTPVLIPFKDGLRKILRKASTENPFLPILQRGDLREFNFNTPALHLHSVRLNSLDKLSGLERKGIRDTISERIVQLYRNN